MARIVRRRPDPERLKKVLAEAKKLQAERATGYRERALALFPHLCGRCGREYSGANLRELTVHHKDHNHDNNPPDGSNWELLCLYCHDAEHQDGEGGFHGGKTREAHDEGSLGHNPFAGLGDLVQPDESDEA